ncbi:Sensor-like histidine kinase senX3 [Pseudoscardovia radai]|uniref:Sensor-like histidine kinase SenX3 n=1 Tax=Pseudoscardovia radai TaxID=987066 RepID=A0A261EZ46_9BIFI|nr:HAMP domain-containing sensor histidine kinase [Pseudoscardovia radai]OZG52127.1 Sensor-like histidine kinase senX3 [Pseudoscardovia radai]
METLQIVCIVLAVACIALAATLVISVFRSRAKKQTQEDDDDDIGVDLIRVLSSLDFESIAVDTSGDVVRATPATYRLGLVRNDAIADDRVRDAIRTVRESGTAQTFELVTHTPADYATVGLDAGDQLLSGDAATMRDLGLGENWLEVTVTPATDEIVLVLVLDESRQRHFVELRDDFVGGVAERLSDPANEILRLGNELIDELGEARSAGAGAPNAQASGAGAPGAGVLGVASSAVDDDAKAIVFQARYLRHLVSDLVLLLSSQGIVGEDGEAAPVSLGDVVDGVIEKETPAARKAKVSFEYRRPDAPVVVLGDARQLSVAVEKLVENALEYSPDDAHVGVMVDTDETGQYARVRVIDNGPGISKDDQAKVFQRFYRGDTRLLRHGGEDGTGLGLSIVRHVALRHRGTVRLWSKPGSGSTFMILIPLASTLQKNDAAGAEVQSAPRLGLEAESEMAVR